jgi:hypothetical protein
MRHTGKWWRLHAGVTLADASNPPNGRRAASKADRTRDVTDLPMIQLRQFRSGGLDALYAISLATGHEGGDVGAPGGGGRANSEDQPHAK